MQLIIFLLAAARVVVVLYMDRAVVALVVLH
jgi:hypothetical protein